MKNKNPFELTEAEKRQQIEEMWSQYETNKHIEIYLGDVDDLELDSEEDLD